MNQLKFPKKVNTSSIKEPSYRVYSYLDTLFRQNYTFEMRSYSIVVSTKDESDCRIVIPGSPPGVYPAVEFQDGDLRTKSSMVTRRRTDLDRFRPRCA